MRRLLVSWVVMSERFADGEPDSLHTLRQMRWWTESAVGGHR